MSTRASCINVWSIAVALVLSVNGGFAASGTWNSTAPGSNGTWTNSLNWSAAPAPYAADAALFNNAGNGQTTVDLAGLSFIKNILFDTPSVAAYTMGSGAANSQTLVLGDYGEIKLSATAANSQTFNCGVQLGLDRTTQNYAFRNDNPSQTLTFNKVFGCGVEGSAGTGAKTLLLSGTGPISILGDIQPNGVPTLYLSITNSSTVTLAGSNMVTLLTLNGGPTSILDIGSKELFLSSGGGNTLNCLYGGRITGAGKLRLSTTDGFTSGGYNYADLYVAQGQTLVIDSEITGLGGIETWQPGTIAPGSGTYVLNGNNTFEGHLCIGANAIISVSKVGNRGSTNSNLGKGTNIYFASTGKLVYTGTGETTDRIIVLNSTGTLEQNGPSGTLTFIATPVLTGGNRQLTLQGSGPGVGAFSCPLANTGGNNLNVVKAGSGTWLLSGTNTYTGSTAVNAGKLLVNYPGSLASGSAVTVNSGALLAGNGTVNGAVTVNAGGLLAPGDANTVGTLKLGGTLALNNSQLLYDISAPDTMNVVTDKLAVAGVLTLNGTNTIVVSFPSGSAPAGSYTLLTFPSRTGTGTFALSPEYPNATLVTTATNVMLDVVGGVYATKWTGVASANWDDADPNFNWTNGSAAVAFAPGDAVAFDDSAAGFTVGSAAPVAPGSVLFNNSANDYTVSAAIDGTGVVYKLGTGTVTLTGSNTFTGAVTVASGTLKIGGAGVLGGGNYLTNIVNGGELFYASSAAQTNSGVISGGGNLTASGSGALTLAGTNSYGGLTLVTNSTLRVGQASALGSTSLGTVVAAGGILELANMAAGGFYAPEPVELRGSLTSLIAGTNTFPGIITMYNNAVLNVADGSTLFITQPTPDVGSNTVTKTGPGLLRFIGDPNHRSVFVVGEGTVELQHGGSTDAPWQIRPGATLRELTTNDLGDAYSLLIDGTFDMRVADTIGAISGSGLITNGFASVTTAALTVNNGGGNGVFSGSIGGNLSLTKAGAGYLTLSGPSTHSGGTTLSGGQLNINHASALGTGALTIADGVSLDNTSGAPITLVANNTINWNGNFTFVGSKSLNLGNGAVTMNADRTVNVQTNTLAMGGVGQSGGTRFLAKNGAGTLQIGGTSTYAGVTTINGGALIVNGSLATASTVAVNPGAILGGSGIVGGVVNVATNGLLAPGGVGSVGTLTLAYGATNALSLTGATLLFDVSNVAGVSDRLALTNVNSKVQLFGANKVALNIPAGGIPAGTYTLITTVAGVATNVGASLSLLSAYPNAVLSQVGSNIVLTVSGAGVPGVTWTGSTSGAWDGLDQNWSDGVSPVTYPANASVTFDDSAVGNFSVSGGAVSPASLLFDNSANDYAVTAGLTGAGPLTKQGSAALTLSGMTAYNPAALALNNGTLTFSGASQLNGGNYANNIFDNGSLIYASSANQIYGGMVAGYGALTKFGNGTLTLAGSNLYYGVTTVNAGVLRVSHAYGLGQTTYGTIVNQGSALDYSNSVNTLSEAITLYGTLSSSAGSNTCNGTVTLAAGTVIDVSTNSTLVLKGFQANGAFTKTGPGWLKFTTDPNGNGVMTVAAGVAELAAGTMDANVVVNAGAVFVETASNALADGVRVTVNAGGTYWLRQSDRIGALSGSGTVTRDLFGSSTLDIYNNNNMFDVFSGVIKDGAGVLTFTKNGYGDFTLSGANTYTGPTLVNGGGLYVNSPGSLAPSSVVTVNAYLGGNGTVGGPVTVNAGGTLVPGGLNAIGTLTLGSTLALSGSTLLVDMPSSGTTCDLVSVAGALTLSGVNTVVLSLPQGSLPAGSYTLMTFASRSGSFVLAGSYPNASLTQTDTSLVLTVTGGGVSGLTWNGNLSPVWDIGTLNWKAGGSPSSFATGAAVTFDDSAASYTVVSGGAVTPSAVTFNNSSVLFPYVVTAPIAGTAPLAKLGVGTTYLNGVDAYNPGSVIVNAGTLSLGAASRLGAGTYNGAIATLGVFNHASSANQTFNGVISGYGQLTKTGGGALTLTAGNTFIGGSTITTGTLIGRGVTNVFGTGTLSLNGGTVDLQNDTAMTFVNNVSLGGSTTLKAGRVNTGNGVAHTLGTLTIGGGYTLTVLQGNAVNNNTPYGLTFGTTTVNGSTPFIDVANNGTGLGTLTLGALNGNQSFTKRGAGLLYLPFASGRSGGNTMLSAGTLKLGHGNALGTTGTSLALNGGVLELACDTSIPAINTSMLAPLSGVTIQSGRFSANGEGITHTLGTLSFGCPVIVTNNANVRANSTFGLAFGATTLTNAAFFDVGHNGTGLGTLTLGALNGNFSLTKRGQGTLKLTGIGTSTGDVTNRNGRLIGVTGGSSSNNVFVLSAEQASAVAKLGVQCNVANTSWACNSLTFNTAAPATTNPVLEFLFGTLPSATTAPLSVRNSATFTVSPTVVVNLSNAGTVPAGTYPLLTMATASTTPALALTMVGGYAGSSLAWSGDSKTLNLVLSGTPSPLAWGTTGSGTWDVNNSANAVWKDNTATAAFYSEQTGSDTPGSRVLFDDAYIASDTAVTLNSFVAPATVAFSNSLYAYTISGVGAIAGNAGLVKAGTNLLTLATANTYTGGTVVAGGTLALASGGAISHAGGDLLVGNALLTNALLKIASGASVSNKWLMAGATNGAAGAIYNQGSLTVFGGANFANFALGYGVGGYGYYRHDTAYPLTVAETGIASDRNGSGVMDVLQGVVTNGSYFLVNRGTTTQYGQVNVTGGRLLMPNYNNQVALFWLANSAGAGVLNVSGGGLLGSLGTATELDLIKTTTSTAALGVLNILSSGTVQATKVKSSRGEGVALVNFNGGTLKAGNNSVILLGGSNIDRATVYANGATVDTDGRYVSVTQPLLAPSGSGVTGIPLTANGTGYIGRPIVSLTGGGGTGATALADFDPVSGEVTGVTVTSPGYGYTSAPAVAFIGGGGVAPTLGSVTVGPVASGGLTKSGNGVLTLSGANTYGGATTVSNGTLRLGAASALPTNSAITVANGATLDLNGYTVTNSALAVLNGSVINGTVYAPTLQGVNGGVVQASIIGTNGLTKSGSDVLTISAALTYPGATEIGGGTVKLVGRKPGLYEGRLNANFDVTTANPKTATPLAARAAYMMFNAYGDSGGFWVDNSTYVYSGYIWNNSPTNETWSFCKAFDDNGHIRINGTNILHSTVHSDLVISNCTVFPGANSFELRLGQGGGGVGANGSGGFTGMGAGFDRLGRGQNTLANFRQFADPGDGSLLTLTNVFDLANANLIPTNSAVSVASGALLDLGGTGQKLTGLSGSGTVSNGTLAVNGTIAPGGLNALGTLSLPAVSATLSGTLRIDVSDDGTCDVLAVGGNASLSGLALSVDNGGQLNPSHIYTIMTCGGARTGTFSSKNTPSGWIVFYEENGDVKLKYVGGTLIRVR
jgi:autotransporter-associated beta strand protein